MCLFLFYTFHTKQVPQATHVVLYFILCILIRRYAVADVRKVISTRDMQMWPCLALPVTGFQCCIRIYRPQHMCKGFNTFIYHTPIIYSVQTLKLSSNTMFYKQISCIIDLNRKYSTTVVKYDNNVTVGNWRFTRRILYYIKHPKPLHLGPVIQTNF